MTLAELRAAADLEPPEVRASRRRTIVRRMQRLPSMQREHELVADGWRDHGGESG